MFKKDGSKNSILKKYIASYIAILLIPLIIVNLVIFSFYTEKFRNEIMEKNHVAMDNFRNVFDIKTDEMMNLAQQVFSNTKLKKIDKVRFVNTMQTFKNELINYVGTNSYVYEMALFVPEADYVFSSLGGTDFTNYAELIYSFDNMDAQTLRQTVIGGSKIINIPVCVRNVPSNRYRACIIKENDLPSSRFLIILLDNLYIDSIIDTFDDDLLIFDGSDRFITDNRRKHDIDPELIAGYLKENGSDSGSLRVDSDVYFISTVQSSSNGYKYVSVTDERHLFSRIISLQWINIFAVVIILIIGVYIITYSMKLFYSPVKRITSMLKRYTDGNDGVFNEFESTEYGINYLIQNQKELEYKVENAYRITRDFMLFKLLNAALDDTEDLKKQFEFYGVSFDLPFYYVALFHIEGLEEYKTSDLPEGFREFISENYCITVDFYENNQICVILPSVQKHHNEENRALITQMKQLLEELTLCRITVCVGNPFEDITNLWQSYIEACSAYDYKLIKGKFESIFFCDTVFYSQSSYSHKKIDALAEYIKAGEEKKAFELIDTIADEIYSQEMSLHTAKCLCFELASNVMNAATQLVGEADREEVSLRRFDLSRLVEFDSMEELIKNIKVFLIDVLNKKTDGDKKSSENKDNIMKENMLNKIKLYIEDNFNQPYICVDNIAEYFKISNTYLSQFFKAKTGTTISEYITRVQLTHTKELLVETDLSIREIAEQMGYTNVSNFIRKFKAKTGVTPGIYRKANTK